MDTSKSSCALCSHAIRDRLCFSKEGQSLNTCPTGNREDLIKEAVSEYFKEENHEFISKISENTKRQTRIADTIDLAKRMGYKKIGFAFCGGFVKEAKIIDNLLRINGFEVVSTMCKVGRLQDEMFDKNNESCDQEAVEPMCNPIMQAYLLNEAKTEFNIVMGLCVGHDALFLKYAEALSTVFATKDKVLAHNPLAAIYTIDSYNNSLQKPYDVE